MECPCKGCTTRWVTDTSRCHAHCDRYKEWSELTKRQKDLDAMHRASTESIGKVLFGHGRR